MLIELSGTRRVWWDVITFRKYSNWEQIICNWKETWCWLDKNWLIGSGDHGWPTYLQRIQWYGKIDRWEFAKRLNANHPELEEKKEKKVEKLNTEEKIYNPVKVPKLIKPDFTRWSRELDGALGKMKKWQLVILLGETWAGKTTFATFMARKNKGCCYYVLEDKVENIASRYAMKRAWITVDQYNEWTRTDKQEQDYEQAYLSFRNRDLLLVDIWKKIEVEELINSIKELKAQWHTLFFIDNLGFIIGNWDSEAAQTADISSKLVSLCLEENICIVLLHHFKKKGRAFDQRDLSQMRGSWKLWDDAFTVVEYIREEDQTFLRVFKDRTRWNLKTYEIKYDRGEYLYIGAYKY
jgi:replicative DNA helicase